LKYGEIHLQNREYIKKETKQYQHLYKTDIRKLLTALEHKLDKSWDIYDATNYQLVQRDFRLDIDKNTPYTIVVS